MHFNKKIPPAPTGGKWIYHCWYNHESNHIISALVVNCKYQGIFIPFFKKGWFYEPKWIFENSVRIHTSFYTHAGGNFPGSTKTRTPKVGEATQYSDYTMVSRQRNFRKESRKPNRLSEYDCSRKRKGSSGLHPCMEVLSICQKSGRKYCLQIAPPEKQCAGSINQWAFAGWTICTSQPGTMIGIFFSQAANIQLSLGSIS